MLETLLFKLIEHYISEKVLIIVMCIGYAWVGVEQYLAATKRTKANSTLQLIDGLVKSFLRREEKRGLKLPGKDE